MSAKRIALTVLCGLLLGSGSQAGLMVDDTQNHSQAAEEPDSTLKSVTTATDIGFLVTDLRALSGCPDSAHCRWTGRAIPWWIYNDSSSGLDTINVLAPGIVVRSGGYAQQFFSGSAPSSGILAAGQAN